MALIVWTLATLFCSVTHFASLLTGPWGELGVKWAPITPQIASAGCFA